MTRRAFGAAGFALLATSAAFAQQQSPPVRVRGTVEGVDGPGDYILDVLDGP